MGVNRYALILVLAALVCPTLSGDHLPENLLAEGPAERLMAGINIEHTTIAEAVKTYGPPKREDHPDPDDPSRGQRSYVWTMAGVRLEVGTWFQPGQESEITSVDISNAGRPPTWKTGRGLFLGGTIADVRRLYGPKFLEGHKVTTNARYVLIQWRDGSEMHIDFGKDERIVHIYLSASLE
jgi:hypothetical protein